MFLSGLRPDPRSPSSLIVEVDGGRVASLPVEVVKELGLVPGEELAPARYEQLMAVARVESARRVALRMLAVRPRASADLARKLRDRGHDAHAIRQAVERLQAVGLLNDAEFARHFARVRSPRGHGPSRLVHDLMGRGIDRTLAERAVADVSASESTDVLAQARAVAEKRVMQLASLPAAVRERRALSFLARRGFRGREVRNMVRQLCQGGEQGRGNREP
jgi:regulatory protein